MPATDRNEVHEKLSDHEKQFTYLPLDILKRATNIEELVLPTIAKGKPKYLDYAISEIHKQMPMKCGRWFSELANLRFIESIEDDEPSTTKNVTNKKTVQKHTEPEPEPSTSKAMPKSKKHASKTSIPNEPPKQSTHELRSRTVNIKIA